MFTHKDCLGEPLVKWEYQKMVRQSNQVTGQRIIYSRREFIAGSVATATFTIIKASTLRGTEAHSRIEVGCIGLGGRGAWIAKHLKSHPGYKITSVADYFSEVAQKVGQELGVDEKRRFWGLSGYKKLIASGVDAVFCETPPYCFPEHVTAAVNAGCHVFIAKPLGCDVPGCLQIAKMAKQATANKKVFLVDFQTRTDPYYIEAIKRVHNGDIDQVAMLNVRCASDGFPDPPKTQNIESRLRRLIWVNDVNLGGGLIVNYDIHAMDVALWIAKAKPVSAMGSARVAKADAHGDSMRLYSLTYQFPNGLILNHQSEHLRNVNSYISCFAYGNSGFLETNYGGKVWIRGNKKPYRGGETANLYGLGMQRNVETFYRSVINRVYDNPTVEPSVNATLATILGREAARKNTIITWDEMLKENKRLQVDLTGLKA